MVVEVIVLKPSCPASCKGRHLPECNTCGDVHRLAGRCRTCGYRFAIEAWEAPLLSGREAALRAARQAIKVAASMRTWRAYGWRPLGAGRLNEAAEIRRAVAAGRVGMRVLER